MILWKRWSSMVKNIVFCQNLWIFDLLWGKTMTVFQKLWNFALPFIFFEQLRKNMALYQNLWYMYYTENTRPQILVYKIMLENPCTEMNKWFSFGITYVLTIITFSIIQLLNTCSYLWKLKTKIYFNKSLQISLIITKWWF